MPFSLSDKAVIRPEEKGALLFQKEVAEACLLSERGLLALRELLLGRSASSGEFVEYLLRREFICKCDSVDSRQIDVIDRVIDEARAVKAPLRSLSAPENIHVYTSNVCDQDCEGCYYRSSSEYPKHFITESLFSKIVKDAKKGRVCQIALGGGEPLLHPRIIDMVGEISQAGIVPTLTSNGNKLSLDMARSLKEAGLVKIQISLNGDTEEINSTTRPNFHNAVMAIQTAIKAGLRTGINFVLTKSNVEAIPRLLAKADDWGCATFNILRPKEAFEDESWLEKESLEARDYVRLRSLLAQWFRSFRTEIKIDDALSFLLLEGDPEALYEDGIWGCLAARRFLNIDPFGNVFACSHVRQSDCGDGDFLRAWRESEVFRKFREVEDKIGGSCASCRYKKCCRGCRAVVLALGKSFYDEDFQCPILAESDDLEVVRTTEKEQVAQAACGGGDGYDN